jgi:hypothetical protein
VYDCETVPDIRVVGEVILRGGHTGTTGLIVISNVCWKVCDPTAQLSVALIVNEKVPSDVGIPVNWPLGLRVIPGGNIPDKRIKDTGNCPPDDCS